MKSYYNTILFIFLLAAFAPRVEGQFVWQLSHESTNQDSTLFYSMIDVKCIADTCIATGVLNHFKVDVEDTTLHKEIVFFRTSDAGVSWSIQDPKLSHPLNVSGKGSRNFLRIHLFDANTAIAVGDSGQMISTNDGGANWIMHDTVTLSTIVGLHFSDRLNGIIGIRSEQTYDQVYITSDGGLKWITVPRAFNAIVVDCYTFGPGRYRVLTSDWGGGYLYVTEDNWQTTQQIPLIDSLKAPDHHRQRIEGSYFLSEDTVLVYGIYHSGAPIGNRGMIIRSTDGGRTWDDPYISPWNTTAIRRMESSGSGDTLIAGTILGMRIFYSFDRGATWSYDTLVSESIPGVDYPLYTTQSFAWTNSDFFFSSTVRINNSRESVEYITG